MRDEITTTDLSRFGWRERKMAGELLIASYSQGFPEDFEDDEVTIMMNTNSGSVFFTNAEYQVAMMNDATLESFYSCPQCGAEGFKDEIHEGDTPDDLNAEYVRYLSEIGINDERTETAEEIEEEVEAI